MFWFPSLAALFLGGCCHGRIGFLNIAVSLLVRRYALVF